MNYSDKPKVVNGMVGEGVKFDRIRRITGYLSSTDNWNNAKQAELKDRVTHIKLKEFNNDC